jgi:hypothetical protein
MAKYLMLIYGDAAQWAAMTAEQEKAHAAAHQEFAAAAGERVLSSHELELSSIAATVVRTDAASGRVTTTDGPFLETKEAVGGYYLLEASDLDEVIALAELLPEVRAAHSGVEIRPVVG